MEAGLTLCGLAVLDFRLLRGQTGPRLGLHISLVHILENI